ncbi:MAG: small, acid-soluble spore protein, H family, partial [Hyphomonadaceae bacterium]|nr:small, acid-soluble spore protein, H family [Clostridia bacterium]
MNIERAKEIYFNPNTIEVLYQGTPVWINYVDPENCAADVSSMLLPSETL